MFLKGVSYKNMNTLQYVYGVMGECVMCMVGWGGGDMYGGVDFALIIGRINLTICKESYTLVINPTIVKSSKLRVFLNYVYISIFFHVSHVKKHVTILLTEKQWIQYQSLFLFLYVVSNKASWAYICRG